MSVIRAYASRSELISFLDEYASLIELDNAVKDIETGDSTLAFNFLARSDIKLFYKIKLLYILSTPSKNNPMMPLRTESKKNVKLQ